MKRLLTCTLFFLLLIASSASLKAQKYDTLVMVDSLHQVKMQAYPIEKEVFLYPRPKPFAFITKIPRTFVGAAKVTFQKGSLKGWALVASSTAILVLLDQDITDGVQRGAKKLGIDPERRYTDLAKFKIGSQNVDVYQVPRNLNSVIYSIGEGVPSLLLSAGLWGYGLSKNDYRAISTASQIVQANLATGVMSQVLKRVAGRESPFAASEPGGAWRPFTKLSVYQKSVSQHDAFPSGHMGTLMSTYVVIRENYPEKRWVRPVGISIMSLVGLAMINNGVHWAGDYPLALGMGYVFGEATVKLNRFIKGQPMNTKRKRR